MPNWCDNWLTVEGTDEALDRFEGLVGTPAELVIHDEHVLTFEAHVPHPATIDPDSTRGYDWRVAVWGTKWDASNPQRSNVSPGCMVYYFSTAWSPPIPWFEAMVKHHPELDFTLKYAEPGLQFAGELFAEYGEVVSDVELTLEDVYGSESYRGNEWIADEA